MKKINIEGIEYDYDLFSDNAKAQLASIGYIDNHLSQLKAETAIYQTARMAYVKALKENLPEPVGVQSDAIAFS